MGDAVQNPVGRHLIVEDQTLNELDSRLTHR